MEGSLRDAAKKMRAGERDMLVATDMVSSQV